jgi:G3E family GTPase
LWISGSAFPATLALQIRQLEPQGFKLDGVVTVIDCVNFRGYEDTSPSAKVSLPFYPLLYSTDVLANTPAFSLPAMPYQLQAQYTDLLLLNKHQLVSENAFDILMDHLGTLNDTTPRIRVSAEHPVEPDVVFGLDTKLFLKSGQEGVDWEKLVSGRSNAGQRGGWHGDEVEVRGVWKGKRKLPEHHVHAHGQEDCISCVAENHGGGEEEITIKPISRELLETELLRLDFEVYRGQYSTLAANKTDQY